MLKQDITYENFDGQEVTETFYFSFTKLEMLEQDLKLDGVENLIKELEKTEDAKKAYYLFKDLVLDTVGKKSPDGNRFVKTPELRADFEASPAMSELIIGFIQDASAGAKFIEGVLPQKMVAEVKAEMKKNPSSEATITELPTAAPVLDGDDSLDFDAMLAEADAEPEPPKKPITRHQAVFMKQKLNAQQYELFMSTRFILEDDASQ